MRKPLAAKTRRLLHAGPWVTLLVLAATTFVDDAAARTPAVNRAQKAYEEVDYVTCLAQSGQALKEPGTLDERASALLLRGMCAAAMGDDAEAVEMLSMLLAIDPSFELESGLSPRITSAFLEAKGAWLDVTPLELKVVGEDVDDGVRLLTLEVSDLTDWVHAVVAVDGEGKHHPPVRAAAKMEMEVPSTLTALLLVDEHGGELLMMRLVPEKTAPVATTTPPPPSTTEATPEAETSAMPLWIGVGAGVGAVVVVGAAAGVATWALLQPPNVQATTTVVFAPPVE